jgi:hypothetical protein
MALDGGLVDCVWVNAPSLQCMPCVHSLVPASLANMKQSQLQVITWDYSQTRRLQLLYAMRTPKGFGPPAPKKEEAAVKRVETKAESSGALKRRIPQEKEQEDADDEVVPEVVTNRMLRRIGFTVGIPFAVGIAVFPLFYYLKVIQKLDVPEWLPLLTSMVTFGSAGAGITYGVLSTSWDPLREGSILGWKEAQLNWPAFWQTLQGKKEPK